MDHHEEQLEATVTSAHRPPAAVDGARAVWARGFDRGFIAVDVGGHFEADLVAAQTITIDRVE